MNNSAHTLPESLFESEIRDANDALLWVTRIKSLCQLADIDNLAPNHIDALLTAIDIKVSKIGDYLVQFELQQDTLLK